ncbi:MAG: endonuclease III [Armatimonadetes bacterium]|nr:endonuclease III [Armatimonadota bacterium]
MPDPSIDTVTRRLEAAYGIPARPAPHPVLDGLIGTILSQNTTGVNAQRALRRLRDAYPTWDDALAATPQDLADAIRCAGLADLRAPRLLAILQRVAEDHGEVSLEALRERPSDAVRAYLRDLPGVGIKTVECVLLFTLGRDEFPVDTHVHRLALRLGWVAQGTSADAAWARLHPLVAPGDRPSLHVNLIRHGREVCRSRAPRCASCCLSDLCPSRAPG